MELITKEIIPLLLTKKAKQQSRYDEYSKTDSTTKRFVGSLNCRSGGSSWDQCVQQQEFSSAERDSRSLKTPGYAGHTFVHGHFRRGRNSPSFFMGFF